MIRIRPWAPTAIVCLTLGCVAQSPQLPKRLTFEVATIRRAQPGEAFGGIKPLPGGDGYTAQNVPVRLMVALMYQVPMRQITGGPGWLDSDRYDVEARADHPYTKDDLHAMFRSLLEDRFHLELRKETRTAPVFALRVDRSGLKMKVDDAGPDLNIPIGLPVNNVYTGNRVPISYLCFWLGQQLQNDGMPVIDKTGLTQVYDFQLSFAPELPPNVARESLPPELQNLPSLFDAVREQLGLRLDSEKGPVDYFVVDRVERPSDN